MGPLIKSIEKVVYSHPAFIKNIPVHLRPSYISKRIIGPRVYSTDYTSFESSFGPLAASVQFIFYSFITNSTIATFIGYCMYLDNRCVFAFFTIIVQFRRMSGDMDTSLGNGIYNLICISYVVYRAGSGLMWAMFNIIVEGDDSLFVVQARWEITKEQFESLGLTVKIETHIHVNRASFCGQIYDLTSMSVLTNPLKVLSRFGYTDRRYLNSSDRTKMTLLRAVAFSLWYQYSGCPVVGPLSKRLLELTRGYHVKPELLNHYKFNYEVPLSETRAFAMFDGRITDESRSIVQELFKLPVSVQTLWEDQISRMQLGELKLPGIRSLVHPDAVHYAEHFKVFEGDSFYQNRQSPLSLLEYINVMNENIEKGQMIFTNLEFLL